MNSSLAGVPGARRGFTLIELLVVIAIISLLVSILLPSLTKAKLVAQNVVCQNHLRGIGIAVAIYMGENDGQYPSPNDDEADLRWYEQIDAPKFPHRYDPDDPDRADPTWGCPSDEPTHRYVMNCWDAGGGVIFGFGKRDIPYYKNYHWRDTEILDLYDSYGQKHSLNRWVMVFEGWSGSAAHTYYAWRSVHYGGGNVLLADGAVEHWPIDISYEEYLLFRSQSGAYNFWWDNYKDYYLRFRGPGMLKTSP